MFQIFIIIENKRIFCNEEYKKDGWQKLSNQMAKNTKVFMKNADKGSAYGFPISGDMKKMNTVKEKRRAKRTWTPLSRR